MTERLFKTTQNTNHVRTPTPTESRRLCGTRTRVSMSKVPVSTYRHLLRWLSGQNIRVVVKCFKMVLAVFSTDAQHEDYEPRTGRPSVRIMGGVLVFCVFVTVQQC